MDELVRRYIDEVERIRGNRSHRLSSDDLADIARQVGATDADLEAVAEVVENRVTRARNFAANGMVDEAIAQLEPALGLAPHRPDLLALAAELHAKKWGESHDDEHRQTALALAHQHIELAPDHTESYRLIKRLSAERNLAPYFAGTVISTLFGGAVGMLAGIPIPLVMGLMLVIVALGIATVRERKRIALAPLLPASEPQQLLIAAPGTTRKRTQAPEELLTIDPDCAAAVVLEVEAAGDWDELVRVEVRRAWHDVYDDSAFTQVVLAIHTAGEDSLDGLELRMTLLADGEVLLEKESELLGHAYQMPAMPGRPAICETLLAADEAIRPDTLRLEPVVTSRTLTRVLSEPKAVGYTGLVPEVLDFEIWDLGVVRGASKSYRTFWWEYENAGDRAIQSLRLQLVIRAEDGDVVDERELNVTYDNCPLLPGEIRRDKVLVEVGDRDGFELSFEVVDIG